MRAHGCERQIRIRFHIRLLEIIKLPGHYIKCVVDATFPLVYEDLEDKFGNIYAKKFSGKQEAGVILGQQYFFRVNSDVAITIILKSIGTKKTEVEIISSAGAAGMMGMTWNAHKVFASEVRKHLDQRFKARVENEISYFGTTRAKAYLKKCVKCDKEIPIASEECQYCGTKQP